MASAAPPSPRPARRATLGSRRLPTLFSVVLVAFLCFASHAVAAPADVSGPVETLVIDRRTPIREGRGWVMLSEYEIQMRRARRAESESSESSESHESTESSAPSKTSSESDLVTTTFEIDVGTQKTTAASTTTTTTTVPPSPFPSILDSLSNDFTEGPDGAPAPCPIFIRSFLANSTFRECYPLSMLFDGSKSFFEAQKSLVSITRTLDATCAADVTRCTTYMNELAQSFIAAENCGVDFERGVATVVDAYEAMRAYAPIYGAGCLKDPETSAYCYANAVTNRTNPSMTHIYFLPLNKALPGATVPTCNYCLQQTMAIFRAATADRGQAIADTYVDAAEQVNTMCGPDFVNENLAPEISAARQAIRPTAWSLAPPLFAAVMLWLA
ncbi:hypothetical protein VTK26DRAFT_3864 [Humicola hyalothermophila]